MKIIDNRYKIEKVFKDISCIESYKINDLWEYDETKFMKLYHYDMLKELISYFTDNFIHLSNIRHDYILSSEKFNLVKSIDNKKTNMLLYYSITEYTNSPQLTKVKDKLNLKDLLHIILNVMVAIDFLHFRGFTYRLLNPSEIFVSRDNCIKLMDLATITEKSFNSHYDDLTRYFISPEVMVNKEENDKRIDYYSLGILIKYLLLQDFLVEDSDSYVYKERFKISKDQKEKLNNIIRKLTKKDFSTQNINLKEIIDEVNILFDLDYSYDIVEKRNSLYFNNKIVGREKEINKVITIDDKIINGTNEHKGLVFNADFGIGKSRLLNEIAHKLKLKGRDVYFVEIHESENNDLLDMSNILKQSMKDTPSELMEKYRNELSRLLPELRLNIDENLETDLNQKSEIFRLYNRIANYFTELSKEKIIYIIIDDLQNCNSNFLLLLDYLIRNVKSNNIFFILSFEEKHDNKALLVENKINDWISDSYTIYTKLHKLNLEEVGYMIQNILGMSYIPMELATAIFKESQGNPRYIEYIMKHLYNIGDLYVNVSGRWYRKGDSVDDLYFPSDIDDALEKQLTIIKEKYLEVFKIISVFDDILYKKMFLNMINIDQDKMEKQLNELIRLKLIDEKVADRGYSYSINNNELKKLIYHEISKDEKIELHKKAAEVIQEIDRENLDMVLEELIYHLNRSNQSEKALDIILENVESLENKRGSHARFLLEKAYNIVKDSTGTTKLEILEKLVDIYYLKGETEKGTEYLKEYQIEAENLKDFKHIIKGKTTVIDVYYRRAQTDLALKDIAEIEYISKENNFIEGIIIALALRARFGIDNGNLKEAEKQLLEAIKLSNEYKIITYMGTIYNRLGLSKYLSGNIEEAIENYKKSIIYHEKTGNFMEATRPINNIGTIYADHYANSEKAMENYKKGLAIATKQGIQEVEIVFLSNISEIYMKSYEFDKALQYIEETKKGAIELQDLNMIFLAHINIGSIYLKTAKYNLAYDCYVYLKEIYDTKQITSMENTLQYHKFLGEFHGYFGEWEKGIEHSIISSNLCKEYNIKEYLIAQCRIIYFNFLNLSYFNKDEIDNIRKQYRNTILIQDRRTSLLYFSIISILHGDINYALDLLEEDSALIVDLNIDYLEKIRKAILLNINPTEEKINDMINLVEMLKGQDLDFMKLNLNMVIGFRLFFEGQYKRSLKYLLETLDNIYRTISIIPDTKLKFSYIKSRKGDLLKEKIMLAIKHLFKHQIKVSKLNEINEDGLRDYFDITPIIDIVGSEEFVKITQLDYYGEALNINSTENLISRFTEDYKHNLNLVLSYLGKESFAKRGFILSYDEIMKKYDVVSSLNNNPDYNINESILNLTNRYKQGILVSNNVSETSNNRYREFLSNEIKGIICVPIIAFEDESEKDIDRRKEILVNDYSKGYIYLETDNVFNRFDQERLEMVSKLCHLIFINLENNKLRLMATTDKLTGTFTRKYYESRFEQLINNMKSINGNFSVLMLDIDKFKNVNDTYGHRKGDEVLASIGQILKSTVRNTDIVARYGGEEFTILLKNTLGDEAKIIAEKIRKNIESLKVQGIDHPITVSMGISLYPQHSQFKEELTEKADQALYQAKETGRNKTVLWTNQMDNTINRVDKLAGILTGNTDEDNRNILALIDVIDLIKEKKDIKEKAFIFLGRLLETIDAEGATLLVINNEEQSKKYFSRARFNDEWIKTPPVNNLIINRVIETRKGEFLIDWDNIDYVDPLSGLPNWQSIMVLPMVKNDEVNGIIYISTPLKNKEFDFNSFNLTKNFVNIFSAIL